MEITCEPSAVGVGAPMVGCATIQVIVENVIKIKTAKNFIQSSLDRKPLISN
jgi:hypothetical protein